MPNNRRVHGTHRTALLPAAVSTLVLTACASRDPALNPHVSEDEFRLEVSQAFPIGQSKAEARRAVRQAGLSPFRRQYLEHPDTGEILENPAWRVDERWTVPPDGDHRQLSYEELASLHQRGVARGWWTLDDPLEIRVSGWVTGFRNTSRGVVHESGDDRLSLLRMHFDERDRLVRIEHHPLYWAGGTGDLPPPIPSFVIENERSGGGP